MSKPFSLRMDDDAHEQLVRSAERTGTSASKLVDRYVKEGLRMDENPGIAFVTAPDGARVPVVAGRPRLRLVDVIVTWQRERQKARATAEYFDLSEDEVEAALRYYARYRTEMDAAIREHLEAQDNFERVIQQRNASAARRVANAG